jgi:vacuolar-type H+-ATPase subunit H
MKISEMIKAEMSDAEVNKAVKAARTALKAAETKAQKALNKATQEAFERFDGSVDVERAARENAIKRAQRAAEDSMRKARETYNKKLDDLRSEAGQWADLVPRNIPL